MIQYSEEDLHKLVGYLLYDMHELGLLNDKGTDVLFGPDRNKPDLEPFPEDLMKGMRSIFNGSLKEKQESGKIC